MRNKTIGFEHIALLIIGGCAFFLVIAKIYGW